MNRPATNFIEPRTFKLLTKIKNQIILSTPLQVLSRSRIINTITDEIIECGDSIGLPIFRIENKFYIYQDGEQILISNREMEKFLLLVCEHVGVNKDIVDDIGWRNSLFGAIWRKAVPGDE